MSYKTNLLKIEPVLVLDKHPSHFAKKVVAACGLIPLYLPLSSCNLNPVEMGKYNMTNALAWSLFKREWANLLLQGEIKTEEKAKEEIRRLMRKLKVGKMSRKIFLMIKLVLSGKVV